MDQKTYWDNKIINWENTIYDSFVQNNKLPLLEKAATPFRKILKRRLELTAALLRPHINNQTVLDLGCGSGILINMLLDANPKELIGIDLSTNAINTAQERFTGYSGDIPVSFYHKDIRTQPDLINQVDIIVGIGFLDYLRPQEVTALFSHINHKYFLFSFPEEHLSLREVLQWMYLKLAGCPGSYKYSQKEFTDLIPQNPDQILFYNLQNIRFVTNIDLDEKQ